MKKSKSSGSGSNAADRIASEDYDEICKSMGSENMEMNNLDWEEFVKKVNNKSNTVSYICECNRSLQRFVFLPTGDFWYYWNIFILLFATIDFILYPYYTAQGFPKDIYHPGCILIYISSLIFCMDLILNFLDRTDCHLLLRHPCRRVCGSVAVWRGAARHR